MNQIHVRHILLKPNELDDDATVREKLTKLRQRILNGEDFAGIASATSEDPGSAPDGGDLGWTGPGTFVPEFDKAIADLKAERDQRAVQDALWLAHRADAGHPHLRQHR